MSDEDRDDLGRILQEAYNPPPEVPRDDMWAAIQAGMAKDATQVISLDAARRRRQGMVRRTAAWGAAAAALLVLGVGIGRMTAPGTAPMASAPDERAVGSDPGVMRVAAMEHLERSEALIRMVRADGASGRVDPAVGGWARGLLTETRLLMDASADQDPAMRELLEDLELVLVQIVGVSEAAGAGGSRSREELDLALDGIERRDVLSRIQALGPQAAGLAGT